MPSVSSQSNDDGAGTDAIVSVELVDNRVAEENVVDQRSSPSSEARSHAFPGENARSSVVLCPPDGGLLPRITCLSGFVAAFIRDGVCLSLVLFDSRVGIDDRAPFPNRAVEHVAVIVAFRYLIEPFSCAYINWYGFRYCLFFGSVLFVIWSALLSYIENVFVSKSWLILSVFGGIGMGMIESSFTVLLSILFVTKRQKAHLILHLGSTAGMLLVPPFTEFVILTVGWQSALFVNLAMACFTSVFWLFVATPMPLKIEIIDDRQLATEPPFRSDAAPMKRDINITKDFRPPTIWDTIGNKKLLVKPFTVNTAPTRGREEPSKSVFWWNPIRSHRLRKEDVYVRSIKDVIFGDRVIGNRPMYRDDIFFDSNVSLLMTNLKDNEMKFLLITTRVITLNDLNQEKEKRFARVSYPTAVSRVLRAMYKINILCDKSFLLVAASEALIHASCLLPFVFIKGPSGLKSSAEAMITLISGGCGLLYGRGIGYFLHQSSTNVKPVPLYAVGTVLIAVGLSLFLSSTGDLKKIIPFFGVFGCMFGYYKSIHNAVLYNVFPLKTFNNIRGQLSIVRGVSSFVGILIAITIQRDESNNENVFYFAGILMMAGGVCVGLLQVTANLSGRPERYSSL